jgi:hypothetical protein
LGWPALFADPNLCCEDDVSVSSDNLRVLYPEFASTTDWLDATIEQFIGWAALELDAETWGVHFERGSLALAAHLMALAKRSQAGADSTAGASTGAVTGLRTGQESITFSAPAAAQAAASDSSLGSTIYGLEYIRLRERVVAGPLYVC